MKYFVLYSVNNLASLSHGLHIHEAATIAEAGRIADEARAMGCSGVRIIHGIELGERLDSPLREVKLEFSRLAQEGELGNKTAPSKPAV